MDFSQNSSKILLIAVVLIVGLIITGAVLLGGKPRAPGEKVVNTSALTLIDTPFVGEASAPLTIVEFADYQCPACKAYELGTFPQILLNYVANGKVRIVFKDFAFIGKDSQVAGQYAHAVWKLYPEKYVAWRAAMYSAQDAENAGFGDASSIDAITASINGIDAERVRADVEENAATYQQRMDKDKAEGSALGVNSTPSFVIGSTLVPGAKTFAEMQARIDAELAK